MNGTRTTVSSLAFFFFQPSLAHDADPMRTCVESDISEASLEDDGDIASETLYERLTALKDMIPPTYRKSVYNVSSTGYDWISTGLRLGGKTLWVVSTSALLLGVPWALAFSEEQQVQEMEREMRMQQSANEMLTQQQQQGAKPAL